MILTDSKGDSSKTKPLFDKKSTSFEFEKIIGAWLNTFNAKAGRNINLNQGNKSAASPKKKGGLLGTKPMAHSYLDNVNPQIKTGK